MVGAGNDVRRGDPPPPVFSRKNVKLKELYVELVQGCDSMALIGIWGNVTELGAFRNGKRRESVSLYTR